MEPKRAGDKGDQASRLCLSIGEVTLGGEKARSVSRVLRFTSCVLCHMKKPDLLTVTFPLGFHSALVQQKRSVFIATSGVAWCDP